MIYRTLLDRAQSRTFHLQRRIQESDAAMKVDEEVEDVISRPEQVQLLTVNQAWFITPARFLLKIAIYSSL
jgi:hypothetical protein